jgi:hypothetical protein
MPCRGRIRCDGMPLQIVQRGHDHGMSVGQGGRRALSWCTHRTKVPGPDARSSVRLAHEPTPAVGRSFAGDVVCTLADDIGCRVAFVPHPGKVFFPVVDVVPPVRTFVRSRILRSPTMIRRSPAMIVRSPAPILCFRARRQRMHPCRR